MVGLMIIAIGTGGIKPCVSAFGGDQFQESQVELHVPEIKLKLVIGSVLFSCNFLMTYGASH